MHPSSRVRIVTSKSRSSRLSPVAETLAPRVPIASAPWALVADTVLPQAGTVSVGGLAFTDELAGEFFCLDNKSSGVYFTFRGTGTECDADAPIQLPDGVTVLSMSCTIFDDNNVGEGGISVALRRVRLSDGASGDVFITPASTDTGTVATYTDVGASFGTGLIDNSSYAYSLRADFGIGLPSSLLRLYGCSVDYE